MWSDGCRHQLLLRPGLPLRLYDQQGHCCIEPSRDTGAARSSPRAPPTGRRSCPPGCVGSETGDLGPDTRVAQEDLPSRDHVNAQCNSAAGVPVHSARCRVAFAGAEECNSVAETPPRVLEAADKRKPEAMSAALRQDVHALDLARVCGMPLQPPTADRIAAEPPDDEQPIWRREVRRRNPGHSRAVERVVRIQTAKFLLERCGRSRPAPGLTAASRSASLMMADGTPPDLPVVAAGCRGHTDRAAWRRSEVRHAPAAHPRAWPDAVCPGRGQSQRSQRPRL